jgi:hypothetical protein
MKTKWMMAGLCAAALMLTAAKANAALDLGTITPVGTVSPAGQGDPSWETWAMENLLSKLTTDSPNPWSVDFHVNKNKVEPYSFDRLSDDGGKNPNLTYGAKTEGGVTGVGSGFAFVLAKYAGGGNSGGKDVVWFLNGDLATLPSSYDGRGLSHYTTFTPVPEPTTLIAGALLLLPFGASALRMVRKNRA